MRDSPAMEEVLTVTDLNSKVRSLLQSAPAVNDVWVSGEISNLARAASGHYYFAMKDQGSEIRCAMFARARQNIDFEPKENMKVTAFGRVDIYIPRGNYQFIIETMRQSGLGELYQEFEKLKKKLEGEGLFDPSRKRPLPRYPRTIGVVTSDTGAVIHDIITTSASRFPADILLSPALVQGDKAAGTIVAGIELLNRQNVDVIIVGRGGGSIEDLWPFNEEPVARAIAASKSPVVSAVGHETDFTIADFVADVRAPTPTGAAAIILRDRSEMLSQLDMLAGSARKALNAVMDRLRMRFNAADSKLSPRSALRELDIRSMALDDAWGRATNALAGCYGRMKMRYMAVEGKLSPVSGLNRIDSMSRVVDSAMMRISSAVRIGFSEDKARFDSAVAKLSTLNPDSVLDRGYSMIVSDRGVVDSVKDVKVGESVSVRFKDGQAKAQIKELMKG